MKLFYGDNLLPDKTYRSLLPNHQTIRQESHSDKPPTIGLSL